MSQAPRTGSGEQVLRCLRLLALSPAFGLEMQQVVAYMGTDAFVPRNLVDASGNRFDLTAMVDTDFDGPGAWVPMEFAEVTFSTALLPVPPYPRLELFGAPGQVQLRGDFDTELVAGWLWRVDAVVVNENDQAEPALRGALALADGFERLVRRNAPSLGGLVELISADGPPAVGGPVEHEGSGNLAGVMQRFSVRSLRSLI
jgi:hypothetical protein